MKKEVAPPIGLKPKHIHDQERVWEIVSAMSRYCEAGKTIPCEWIRELELLSQH